MSLSDWLMRSRARRSEPLREPGGGTGDAEGGDHPAVAVAHGRRDTGEADLELVDRGGVAAATGPSASIGVEALAGRSRCAR